MFFSRLHVVGDIGINKRISSLRELRDNLAIHGDRGVLSTSTISRHVPFKLTSGQKYSRKRLGKCASKIIYCKRHVFSCQTVDKSATIICISGAKTLPSGRVNFEVWLSKLWILIGQQTMFLSGVWTDSCKQRYHNVIKALQKCKILAPQKLATTQNLLRKLSQRLKSPIVSGQTILTIDEAFDIYEKKSQTGHKFWPTIRYPWKIMFSIQQTEAEFEQFESHSFSSKIIFKQAVENLVRTLCKIVRF